MVDVDDGHTQAERHAFGKACADEERAEQARPAGEGDGREVVLVDAGAAEGRVDDGDDILLMGA